MCSIRYNFFMANNYKKSLLIKKLLHSTNIEGAFGQFSKIILENIHRINLISIDTLSELTFCSQSTISKFIKKLGYDSFELFKFDLTEYLNGTSKSSRKLSNNQISELIIEFSRKISNYDFKSITKEFTKAHKILIFASGGSNRHIEEFYISLKRMGVNVIKDNDFSTNYANAFNADEYSYVICVSNSYKTIETVLPANLAFNKSNKGFIFTSNKSIKSRNNIKVFNCSEYIDSEKINPIVFSLLSTIFFSLLINSI